mmetsp:Transcript_64090/g.171513  ORF Transcript_64090/g.171513 Transcript_64090/m.171513 type:complete len:161 (+) Transcript_64090:44-526(+)
MANLFLSVNVGEAGTPRRDAMEKHFRKTSPQAPYGNLLLCMDPPVTDPNAEEASGSLHTTADLLHTPRTSGPRVRRKKPAHKLQRQHRAEGSIEPVSTNERRAVDVASVLDVMGQRPEVRLPPFSGAQSLAAIKGPRVCAVNVWASGSRNVPTPRGRHWY